MGGRPPSPFCKSVFVNIFVTNTDMRHWYNSNCSLCQGLFFKKKVQLSIFISFEDMDI